MNKLIKIAALTALAVSCNAKPKDGEYRFDLLTTNDIHGTYFDSTYVGNRTRPSLLAVNYYVDSIRNSVGKDNVILIDDGDFLQGDNAAYYFNYVDTNSEHLFSRMVKYMGYDAIVGGNHDIETGHDVYDRVAAGLEKAGIPFLAGNAIKNDDGKPYFTEYTILKRHGIKIAILGYDNANIKAWLNESLWSGMHFDSLLPLVQNSVDRIKAAENPDLVIVACHTGTGNGDGNVLESQGLDLFNSLTGVDAIVLGHDHRPYTAQKDNFILINTGSHARNLGHGVITVTVKGGKVVSKDLSVELIPVDEAKTDAAMRAEFSKDYEAVKAFTTKEVGTLGLDLNTRDALTGMSDYINFIQTVCLECEPAQLAIVAPLNTNTVIKAGTLIYNDLFTLYQYENQLFVVQFTGKELKDYLEVSYDSWVNTASKPGDHVLNIAQRPEPQGQRPAPQGQRPAPQGQMARWSFMGATFNLDSMAGLNYTVDITKPFGQRINISTLANGEAFDLEKTYNVAMTSYRASGGGDILKRVGIDTDKIDERVVQKYPEIRELIYEYLKEHGTITSELINNPAVIGHWEFVPENIVKPGLEMDKALLFGGERR